MGKQKPKDLFEKVKAEIVDETKSYIKFRTSRVKRKLLKVGEASFLFFVGSILIIFGVAKLLERFFPIFMGGFGYLFFGVVLVILGMIIR